MEFDDKGPFRLTQHRNPNPGRQKLEPNWSAYEEKARWGKALGEKEKKKRKKSLHCFLQIHCSMKHEIALIKHAI